MKRRAPTAAEYSRWRSALRGRGIEVEISREQWIQWWRDTGQYHLRGNYRHCVNMSRLDIREPFALHNIVLRSAGESHANCRVRGDQ